MKFNMASKMASNVATKNKKYIFNPLVVLSIECQ